MLRLASLSVLGGLAMLAVVSPADAWAPGGAVLPADDSGANIQRSMSLMANSTGLKRNTVRVLYYGQSHAESDWTRIIGERLRRQYPLVNFVIENRAIGGNSAQLLVKNAEADLYPFYPDLVIFIDYGDAAPYEAIIRRIRELTTADILIATDHVAPLVGEKMDEETDPLKLRQPKPGDHDAAWRSCVFLPAIAKKYGAELADVRTRWKQYLNDQKLKPGDLLYDDLHLNARGNDLMAEIVHPHLRHRPDLPDASWIDRVKTFSVGQDGDVSWKNGKLVLAFEGNKVDLICKEGPLATPAAIRIDGKKPSEFPELYVASRSEVIGYRTKPVLLRVQNASPLILENWSMTITGLAAMNGQYRFKVTGSITGEDGEGEAGKHFVSKSGRVVLDPDDFWLGTVPQWAKDHDGTAIELRWKAEPFFADEFLVPTKRNPFGDTVVIAAQGLSNGTHTLEITGGPDTPLAAIRVHRPPLGRK